MWWKMDTLSNCSIAGSRQISRRHRLSTNTVWWTGVVLSALVLLTCSYADPSKDGSECGAQQYKCICGVPPCIEQALVKNGEKDCQDGSDEGQWDPSKCAIKNTTSEDIRFKRAAISELSRLRNGDATTTFFGGDRGRTRPVGLLSTSLGSFVTSGTTTEYVTKVLGTYIKGTYARIISTSSRIYHAVATEDPGMSEGVRPTGLIASTVSTEINGYATTEHTTDFYRTYIDGTYAQLVSSYSQVQYPPWYTDKIVATAVASAFGGEVSDIQPSSTADAVRAIYATPVVHLPAELSGNFVSNNLQSKAFAELGIVAENNESNRLRALRPNGNPDNELRVTGTHGKFVHTEVPSGEETTYNVFTGSYLQNSKTFLFFFGNTVIAPSKSASGEQGQTILVENGTQRKNNVVVDMSRNLKVIVPSKNNRVMIDGSIDGQRMEGVVVEIEGSEPVGSDDEFISVDGAHKQLSGTPSDPTIDMVTVTLEKNPKTRVSTSSSSSSSAPKKELENEIPIARRIPSAASLIRPSQVSVSLPTFTVGQPDRLEFEEESSTVSSKDRVVNVETSSSSSHTNKKSGAPVFNKPATERTVQRTTSKQAYTPTLTGRNVPDRNHRAFKGFDSVQAKFNDVDSDLQSAASTGRATVTYVGFADFTTTVGNTVIVFMPRTKMIEDLSVHATKTQGPSSPVVEPTRFVYQTDEDEPVATTPRRVDDEHVRFSVSQSTGPSKPKSVSSSAIYKQQRPRGDDDEETTTEISPSDTTVTVSGSQTILTNVDQRDSRILIQKQGHKTLIVSDTPSATPALVSPSPSSSVVNRRNSLFSNSNRVRFTPKLSRTVMLDETGGEKTKIMSSKGDYLSTPTFTPRKSSSPPGVYATASTAVFQTDQLNPTGLVTSIVGTVVKDSTTTLYTSLVYGTFIGSSYAQVIKSTSKVYFLLPSKASGDSSSVISATSSAIRPTPVAKFSNPSSTASVYSYEVTTTESSNDEVEGETTTEKKQPDLRFKSPFDTSLDRMEVSVSTTTESSTDRSNKNKQNKPKPVVIDDDEIGTTTGRVELEDSYYDEGFTTTETSERETENEIDTRRKVQGTPQEQIIVDKDQLEATPAQDDEDQTIYVTRTLPTTVYRTYTYYTTFFIPKDDTTLTSVISREVTSSHKGLVRKTFTNFLNPSESLSEEAVATKSVSPALKSKSRQGVKVRPSSSQIIYKTFFTTYTYLTTFFTGQTSSVSSREEIVSNVVTLTHGPGSGSSSSSKIEPTSSHRLQSSSFRTASPRLSSSARQGGYTAAGASSSLQSSRGGKYSVIKRQKASSGSLSPTAPEPTAVPEEIKSPIYTRKIEPSSLTTILKTFYTTYTYFTTLFNGDETSIKSRTEVFTNVVPTIGRSVPVTSSVVPTVASPVLSSASVSDDYNYYDEEEKIPSSSVVVNKNKGSSKSKDKETTFYTTYTYLTTLTRDGTSQLKSNLETYTNVLVGDSTIRSGRVKTIEPTKLSGRSAATRRLTLDDDLNGVGSHLSETSETTVKDIESEVTTVEPQKDYYELEGSEGVTTDKSMFDEHELEAEKGNAAGEDDSENQLRATPALKTVFTTFTFFTTYYKGSSSSVSSRLETVTNVVSDHSSEATETPASVTVDPTYPITYFTTYTYWTTTFVDGSNVVNSREETISNVVTPGVDDKSPATKAIKATEINEIVPKETLAAAAASEAELTTYFTTYTYFTTSYIGESTVVNSHLETVTNVISGTATVTDPAATASIAGRAIGNAKPDKQQVAASDKETEYQDYDLPTGLLSTIVSSEVADRTTTLYSTDVFGTYIDGIYAQVLESTSMVITPTAAAETRFMPEATETPTGVVSVNEGKTVDADGASTTFYTTMAYGTVIDGKYAHLIESTSSIKKNADVTLDPSENQDRSQRTGLVRVIDGTLVEGDSTTFYTSSILGTFIDGQYAQVIESTSRYIISPTKTDEITTIKPTKGVEIESSITEEGVTEEIPTTTEKDTEQEEENEKAEEKKKLGIVPPRKFGASRTRQGSRLSFTSSSKSFTPQITPFASRSRPPTGFQPRRRQSSAVIVTRTDEVTPTVTATLASGSRNSFQGRKRFQKPGTSSEGTTEVSSNSVTTATPKLPYSSRGTNRFQRPGVSGARSPSSAIAISPSSAAGGSGSSPGARGRSSYSPRGSSSPGARGRGSSTSGFNRGAITAAYGGSSSSGNRGATSSRFASAGRGRSSVQASVQPTSVSTTVKPTQTPLGPDEEEYEIEYEYEVQSPASSTTTTTEAPKTTSRFSGGNRFRLSPKLSTPAGGASTAAPTAATTRGLPFLRRQSFAKPTFPTRGTTASTSSTAATVEYEEEYEEEEIIKPVTTPTKKPTSPLIKRPGGLVITQRPTARPTSRGRTSTTQAPAATTTKRVYTPRARPAGFPRPVGVTRPTSTNAPVKIESDDDLYEDGEFEYEESRNVPNITVGTGQVASASELVEKKVAAPEKEYEEDESAAESAPGAVRVAAPEGHLEKPVNVGDLVDSGSEFFESAVGAPYESYDYYSDDGRKEGSVQGSSLLKRSVRQVADHSFGYYNFGARVSRGTLRSNFNSRVSNSRNSQPNSRATTSLVNSDYDDYYYYDEPTPSTTAAPARANRFRGRSQIQPTSTSRRTPFTLTNSDSTNTRSSSTSKSRISPSTNTRPSSSNTNSRVPPNYTSRRTTPSRYSRPTEATTTSRTSRFRSRYNSPSREATTSAPTYNSRSRFTAASRGRGAVSNARVPSYEEPAFEMTTITVTHYLPAETSVPFVNGKSTEYKTIITPSPSLEVLSPFQYTNVDYQGKNVLVINSELTSTPSFGVTEVTRFLIRQSSTTTVTFTPTTIRGRKTSFSHIIPSTVYSVEPVVSTITNNQNPLTDNNQLTNLLLNQLLGQGLLNPNLLALQQQQQQQQYPLNNEPATPVTQYNTKTTSYVTTVTDYTSTVIPITLHGKAIKTTIVESSTHVITATEFITESTVITPTNTQQQHQATHPAGVLNQLNPALLQGLLQSQLLQQQQQQLLFKQPIQPTQPALLQLPTQQPQFPNNINQVLAKQEHDQEEESNKEEKVTPPKAPDNNLVVEVSKASAGVPPGSSVVTLYVSVRGRGRVVKEPLESNDNREVTEQRVSGGRLFIQSGRNLATKVMSNGVEVIVRGDKTAYVGYERTPLVPVPVATRPITLPPSTVSRQFHLVELPGKPNNVIGHLLNSIVRSATPDMVTKTMVTTFTYLATVLHNQSTVVSSREEVISNVMTQKFRPSIEYTPSLKAEASTLHPDLLQSLVDTSRDYFTNTLTTTYTYYNTFTAGSQPVVLTSRETVSNVITLPAYLSPTLMMMSQSRVFETETYYTTFTFSKTLLPSGAQSSRQVVTTKEVVTQVVVTEALIPTASATPMLTPIAPFGSRLTSTFYTTYTHMVTALNEYGERVVTSSINVVSSIHSQMPQPPSIKIGIAANTLQVYDPSSTMMDFVPLATPSISYKIKIKDEVSSKRMEPVLIYNTKTYYTTYTYYTTVVGEGAAKIQSRTQVVSKLVTEALTTELDIDYVNALKSSYLAKHSTFIEITSSVKEIIPAKTIKVSQRPGTLMTQAVFHPHWPKDDDQLAVEVEGTTTDHNIDDLYNHPLAGASSEEHFDEMKEGIHKIVNVLTDTQGSDDIEVLSPSRTYEYLYSTMPEIVTEADRVPEDFMEVDLKDPDYDYGTTVKDTGLDLTEKPVISHIPTPPLKRPSSAPASTATTASKTIVDPFLQQSDIFPDLGPPKSVLIDYPSDIIDYSDDVYGELTLGQVSSLVDVYVSSVYKNDGNHGKGKETAAFGISRPSKPGHVDPTQQIFDLLSEITGESGENYDELKTSAEEVGSSPNIYNISTTFDTYTYNLKLAEAQRKNQTLMAAKNTTKTKTTVKKPSQKPTTGPVTLHVKEEVLTQAPTFEADETADRETEEPSSVTEDSVTDDSTVPDGDSDQTTKKPTKKPYRTTPRPKKRTTKPPPPPVRESGESEESSTTIYSLGTIPLSDVDHMDSNSDEDDQQADINSDTDETLDDSDEALLRRPSGHHHSGGGPSKSSLAIPTIGSGVAVGPQVVSATATGYNWKPLLNLGAIGLGGLGASGLTKLGPLFNSMAGYMKGALLPIARNDTFQKNGNTVNTNERPFHRFPPKEGPIVSYNEPVYIPVGGMANTNNKNPSFRTPDDRIPRRPIISHAAEQNFRPLANDREPDVILGPLPPPIHFDGPEIGPRPSPSFPPTHNYNFRPPNDEQPNIFTQMDDGIHKNANIQTTFEKQTPSSQVIKIVAGNPIEVNRSPSPPPPSLTSPEAKTDMILRPLSNLLNGRPMFSSEPSPSPHPPMRHPTTIWTRPPASHSQENFNGPGPTRFINRPEPTRGSSSEVKLINRPGFRPRPTDHSPSVNEIRDHTPLAYSTLEPYNAQRPGSDIPPRQPITPDNINIPRPTRPALRPLTPPWGEGNKVLFNSGEISGENDNRNAFTNNRPQFNNNIQRPHSQERPDNHPSHFNKNSGQSFPTRESFFPEPNMFSPENLHRMPTPPTPPPMRRPEFPEFTDFLPDLEPTIGNRFPEEMFMNQDPNVPFTHRERPFFQGAIEIQKATQPKPTVMQRPVFRRPPSTIPTAQSKPQNSEKPYSTIHSNVNTHENNDETQSSEESQYRPPNPLGRPFLTQIHNHQTKLNNEQAGSGSSVNNRNRNPLRDTHQQGQLIFGPHNADDKRVPFRPIPSSSEENAFRPNKNFMKPVRTPFRPPLSALRPNRNQNLRPPSPSPSAQVPFNLVQSQENPDDKSEEETSNSVHPHHASQERPMPISFSSFKNENFELKNSQSINEQKRPSGIVEQVQNRFPQFPKPTPHFPPYKQRPNTVYIVHETYDPPTTPTTTTTEPPITSPVPYFKRTTTDYPKLIIKEIPTKAVVPYSTSSTTTSAPQTVPNFLPNRATISKLFIRRFTTPFTTTTTTPKPLIDTYIVSPTVNDLLSFEEKFVNKYGVRTTPNPNNRFAGKLPNTRFNFSTNVNNHKEEHENEDENDDESYHKPEERFPVEKLANISRIIEKPFLNLDKYFTNVGDSSPNFGQDPSGSEDTDTIIDPKNHQVIKSPFDSNRASEWSTTVGTTTAATTTTSATTTTTTPAPQMSSSSEETLLSEFSVPEGVFSSSPPAGSNLWWPTTYRPKNPPTTTANEISDKIDDDDTDLKPTTFRGDILRPTTYRPRPLGSRFQPGRDVDVIRKHIRRPAPQSGMASFYDDEDSMDQLKLKNIEIHKNPGMMRRPIAPTRKPVPVPSSFGAVIDSIEEYDDDLSHEGNKDKNKEKPQKRPISEKERDENNEYDDNYDDDASLELSAPGYPANKLRPPSPPPNYEGNGDRNNEKPGNDNNGKRPTFFREPSKDMLPPPPQTKRPGALQTLTNMFRRPNRPVRPDNHASSSNHAPPPPQQVGGRRPFPQPPPPQRRPIPNNNFNRRPLPPQRGPPQRPSEPEYQENNFNQLVKPIPLNPNAEQDRRPPPPQNRPTGPAEESHEEDSSEKEDDNGGEKENIIADENRQNVEIDDLNKINIEDQKRPTGPQSNKPSQPPSGTGHRESSYAEEDEYYEDDEDGVNTDKNNVQSGLQNQGPINYPKPPQLPNRPFNIGGHLANNNRPQQNFPNPQRLPPQRNPGAPPFPPRPLPPPGSNNGFKFERPESHDPFRFPPGAPKTELEPPPIDSNRIKSPVLELPSNGPIRYRPNGPNQIRPNLLRPEEELFKPTPPRTTVHTIASVDHDNKILGTNTFTAILPTKELNSASIAPSETVKSSSSINPTEKVELEGSETTIAPSAQSSAASAPTTSISNVIKYSGGKLQTSAITHSGQDSQVSTQASTRTPSRSVLKIVITKTSTIHRTRGSAAASSTTDISPTKTSEVAITTRTSAEPPKYQIINRRPTGRPTTTPAPSTTVEQEEITNATTKISVRKPFLPTRGPNLNVPWRGRSTTTTTEKPENATENPSEGSATTMRFSPPIVNISKIINKYENRVRGTTTPPPDVTTLPTSTSIPTSRTRFPPTTADSKLVASSKEGGKFSMPPELMRPTTYRPPFRRPGISSRERFTTIITKIITTAKPPLSSPGSVVSKSPGRNVTTISSSSSSSTTDGDDSKEEYYEDDEEYEEEEDALPSKPVTAAKEKETTTISATISRQNSTSSPNRTVSVSSSEEINPTKVNQRGRHRSTSQIFSRTRGVPFSSSTTQTTRFVTHTETKTQTLTETEITVMSSAGGPVTHTIMITKTLPPQTLISTIVGTVTLVNSVEVKPTTVRTTIFSEPTKAVYTFVDTSEKTKKNNEDTTEKVLRGGFGGETKTNPRPSITNNRPLSVSPALPPTSNTPFKHRPFSVLEAGCHANCSSSGNQMCRTYVNGTKPKCDCKPGYARMKQKFPCRPTFTYEMRIALNHMDGMSFDFKDLQNSASDAYQNFITVTKDAIDKAFLATDIKRQFQGAEIMRVNPIVILNDRTREPEPKVNVDFLVQLTTNVTDERIKNHLIRTLKATNFSIGRTGISSTRNMSDFSARDFNECTLKDFNDCSPNAECINIKGSYTCRCKSGYKDRLMKKHRPGRDCYEMAGCAECNYKGNCYVDSYGNPSCDCFRWYGGAECQINLKVLLISIIGIGAILFLLVLLCGILVCRRNKMNRERPGSGRFMRYRSPTSQATLDRAAIMNDSSSDGSQTPPVRNTSQAFTPDSLLIETDPKGPSRGAGDVNLMNFSLRNVVMDQQDRSLTVVIPRAKIRPSSRPQSTSHLVSAALGPDTNADLAATERKLISYLDQSPYPPSVHKSFGATTSHHSTIRRNDSTAFRKLSLQEQRKISTGALVSSGTEVSARGGMRRRSIGLEPEPFYKGYEKSVSEVRSFDETIRSPSKQHIYTTETSRQSCYSHCKPPSYCAYSESAGHTMAEKDGASTVYTTQGKLFRMMNDDSDSSVCE